jgi:hypothetical protein
MIAFLVVVVEVLLEGSPQGRLPEENQPRQALLFDRLDPSLRKGVQIGTPGWQRDGFDVSRFDDLIKQRTEFTISVMEQVPAIGQKAVYPKNLVAFDF